MRVYQFRQFRNLVFDQRIVIVPQNVMNVKPNLSRFWICTLGLGLGCAFWICVLVAVTLVT
ncbi:MAG: hypothetical protein ACK456_07715 [Pseudanabaenaceae cyanobacterium]